MPAIRQILPICAAMMYFALTAAPPARAGEVTVLRGDLLILDGQRHRLAGIAAPVPGQKCILRGRIIDCGRIATSQLKDLTAGADVRCRRGGDGMSLCTSDGYDLSEGMVHTGWARALNDKRRKLELAARAARRGMWRTVPVTEKTK